MLLCNFVTSQIEKQEDNNERETLFYIVNTQ